MLIRRVVGPSMEPTLLEGDIILANRVDAGDLKPGDIVISHYHGRDLIKRLIEINDNQISIQGDNMNFSNDSRSFGYIPIKTIKGRVFIIWPKSTRWPRVVARYR